MSDVVRAHGAHNRSYARRGTLPLAPYDTTFLSRSATNTRTCYVCGCDSPRRQIAEPLLLPICLRRECKLRAEQLPARHCSIRLAHGELCGAPAAQMQLHGRWVCTWH